jgi:hypothetical protein
MTTTRKSETKIVKKDLSGGIIDVLEFPLLNVNGVDVPEYAKQAARVVGQLVTITPRGATIGDRGRHRPLKIPAVKLRDRVFIHDYPLWQDTRADIARFFDEYTIQASTATLIGPSTVLAAAHAVPKIDVEAGNTFFVPHRTSERKIARPRGGTIIKVSKAYYRAVSIQASEARDPETQRRDKHADWAILTLERALLPEEHVPIPLFKQPLNLLADVTDSKLFCLTHPLGLPLKYGKAEHFSEGDTYHVRSDFGSGSSGAPLLIHTGEKTYVLGIITGNARFTLAQRFETRSGFVIDPLRCVDPNGTPQPMTSSDVILRALENPEI